MTQYQILTLHHQMPAPSCPFLARLIKTQKQGGCGIMPHLYMTAVFTFRNALSLNPSQNNLGDCSKCVNLPWEQ